MGEREAWIGSNSAVERHDRAGIEGQCLIAAEYERVPCGRRRRGQCKPISICQHDEASPIFVLATQRLRRAVMEDIDPRSASGTTGSFILGLLAMAEILAALFSAIKDVRVLILTAIRVVFSEAAAGDCVASIKRLRSRNSFRAG